MPAVKESVFRHSVQDANAPNKQKAASIIDIRGEHVEISLKEEIASMIDPHEGPRALPTLLLYNERGLQLFEDITYLDEYYLTNKEISVLKKSCADIASRIAAGSMVIELGSGNLRKICLLLQAFEDTKKPVDYYALDLNREELERTLAAVPDFQYVACHGLLGTYDDGKEWLKQPNLTEREKCLISLGSSIGNFGRNEAVDFLKGFADVLGPADAMIIGLDGCNRPEEVFHAYNDKSDVTHQFTLNGLINANSIYAEDIFHLDDWEALGEYVYDADVPRHQAFVSPLRNTSVLGTIVRRGEKIKIEQSLKYSYPSAQELWKSAGFQEFDYWHQGQQYGLHFVQPTASSLTTGSSITASSPATALSSADVTSPMPSLNDWNELWAAWDIVTKQMLANDALLDKPIKLRNACIFYLGHVPAFIDLHLSKATGEPATEPASFHVVFERGIDPDVDDPSKCNSHSEIPNEWPSIDELQKYQEEVQTRMNKIYADGVSNLSRQVARSLWLSFEHSAIHLETFLYMVLQSEKTLPPPDVQRPDFRDAAIGAFSGRVPNQWFDIPEQEFLVGMDDPEDGGTGTTYFGWDIEKPSRKVQVKAFQAQGRPITNEEYAEYMIENNVEELPASWSANTNYSNGHGPDMIQTKLPASFLDNKGLRTVFGLVPLRYALDWPIAASYEELSGCATWMGGRIPTFEEAQSIYAHAASQTDKPGTQSRIMKKATAVNGHLTNDGVEETPPQNGNSSNGVSESAPCFADLTDANVWFKNWHPISVTQLGDRLGGQASLGGVWEWTSSPLRAHDGFQKMSLYPGYSSDFFDEKHNIVLGGSWATHPRIAGRDSFVSWYQRNYRYAWVGARLVRDVPASTETTNNGTAPVEVVSDGGAALPVESTGNGDDTVPAMTTNNEVAAAPVESTSNGANI